MDMLLPYESYRLRYRLKTEALYHALKDAVTDGKIPAGSTLPASRELAKQYGLSRGTVNTVYETLASEGYLVSEVGRGTRVCYTGGSLNRNNQAQAAPAPAEGICLSEWGERVSFLPLRTVREEVAATAAASTSGVRSDIRFDIGIPDMEPFPFDYWNRLLYAEVREMGSPIHREPFQAQGHEALREAVAYYLKRSRGLDAKPEQIVIVNGSMQAIALICQLLINPGDTAAVEDPGYSGTRRAVAVQGGRLVAIPAGESFVPAVKAAEPKLLFVTPGRQFPTGTVMPLEARLELLDWASSHGRIIVEDDYDSEFRHRGRPLEPLKALDRSGSAVVYIGTFSKILPPGHRIGYALLPEALVGPFVKAKQLYEPHPTALLEQRAMARFMQSGQYERHLRRMKRIYSSRFHSLKQGLEHMLKDCWDTVPSDCGLHLFAWWKHPAERWESFREACRREGVDWTDTKGYFALEAVPSACFGFSHLSMEEIAQGVERMEAAWRKVNHYIPG